MALKLESDDDVTCYKPVFTLVACLKRDGTHLLLGTLNAKPCTVCDKSREFDVET